LIESVVLIALRSRGEGVQLLDQLSVAILEFVYFLVKSLVAVFYLLDVAF
jgi:hypothetical protein